MSTKNKNVDGCEWISLYKTTNCGRQLAKKGGPYCSYHDYLIRKGSENHICSVCGVGIKSKLNLCVKHGIEERNEIMKGHNKKRSIFNNGWNRLKKIKCF